MYDSRTPEGKLHWYQFSLRTVLSVTVITALALAMFARPVTLEALLFGVIVMPILIVAVCAWSRWPWQVGYVLVLVLAVAVTPPDPFGKLILALPACVVYVCGLLTWKAIRKRAAK